MMRASPTGTQRMVLRPRRFQGYFCGMTTSANSINALLAAKDPVVSETYSRLLSAVRGLGPVVEEPNKSSIHLKAGPTGSAFAGVHPRRAAMLLNIRSDKPIASSRVRKTEQVSKNRVQNELLVSSPAEIDAELLAWLAAAYSLSAQ